MLARRWCARAAAVLALAAVAGLAGCGKDGSYATVSGTVTQDGTPLDGGKVTFYSTVEVDGKRTAYGAQTDSSGKYLIVAVGKEPGIPPGLYKVTITKPAAKGAANLPADWDAAQAEAAGLSAAGTPLRDYENPATTKLSSTLEAGKNENVNFSVKSK
jgi:hypothetical protein